MEVFGARGKGAGFEVCMAGILQIALDFKHDRRAATPTDNKREVTCRRQMNVVPFSFEETLHANSRQVARYCPVEQETRRLPGRKSKVNSDGVPLVRTNHQAIGAECEALLVAAGNQLFE
jgi:hypothetical protein